MEDPRRWRQASTRPIRARCLKHRRPAACFPTRIGQGGSPAASHIYHWRPGAYVVAQTKPTHVDISSAGGGGGAVPEASSTAPASTGCSVCPTRSSSRDRCGIALNFDRRNVKSQGGELRQVEWIGSGGREFVCTAVTFGVFCRQLSEHGLVYRDCIWSLHASATPPLYLQGRCRSSSSSPSRFFSLRWTWTPNLLEAKFPRGAHAQLLRDSVDGDGRLPRVPFVTALTGSFSRAYWHFHDGPRSGVTNQVARSGRLGG